MELILMDIININMEKKINDLYLKDDPSSGESDYYIDKDLTIPYSGIVIDEINGIIVWKFDVKNGKRTGLEYLYSSDGKIEQINECRGNVMLGVSKEFDEEGNVKSSSVVYNNYHIRVIKKNNELISEIISYDGSLGELPEYLHKLLKLSDKELIEYKFRTDNPYLNIE